MVKILLVEDDLTFCRILENFLSKQGYEVEVKHNLKDALRLLPAFNYDAVLLDYRLPDGTGLELLQEAVKNNKAASFIMMTSFNDIRTAVKTIKAGALDYITKPINPEELTFILKEALNKKKNNHKKPATENLFIDGKSEASKALHQYINLVAPTDLSVIIQGDSGTGKEHLARKIHDLSKRAKSPFIAIDCGALSKELAGSELFGHFKGSFTGALQDKKGLFEAATGGTLFLDEVGNLSYEVQVQLLRALQEKVIQPIGGLKPIQIDVRVITATNDDLIKSVKEGTFREDLYHRLNEFKIKVPSLKERAADLGLFIDHFRTMANAELGRNVESFDPALLNTLLGYDWPGNLRELKNAIRRCVLLTAGPVAGMESLPEEMIMTIEASEPMAMTPTNDLKAVQEINERELIEKTLHEVKYNKTKAAGILNIDRKTLYHKMKKYNING
jgi:two-component system, NtrC family, response regulator HydG